MVCDGRDFIYFWWWVFLCCVLLLFWGYWRWVIFYLVVLIGMSVSLFVLFLFFEFFWIGEIFCLLIINLSIVCLVFVELGIGGICRGDRRCD